MKRSLVLGTVLCLSAVGLKADFTYEQSSQITGGMMAAAMKMAGAFSKTAREPIKTTFMVQGNRMVTLSRDSANITDLDKETITDVNFQKKTYSVMTFAQMAQAMQELSQKMKQSDAQVDFKASVKDGEQTKLISGLNTKLVILTLEMENTDPKTGQKGTMVVTSEMWMAPTVPGYNEVRDFHMRMAKKLNWTPGGGVGAMGGAGVTQGMKGLYTEAAKLEGVPVLQVTRMGMKGEAYDQANEQKAASQNEREQSPKPNAGEAASNQAAGRLGGGLAGGVMGGLGGLGGFGRKKKTEPAKEPTPPPPPPPVEQAKAQPAPAGAPGSLMVMNTELSSFAPSADATKFQVPAGFKQVESEMLKRSGK